MSNPNVHIVSNKVFALRKKSKWTWEALNENKVVATDKSRPKLKAKLDSMFEVKESVDDAKASDSSDDKSDRKAKRRERLRNKKSSKKPASPVKKERKTSMRSITLEMMKGGKDDDEILEKIKSEFPDKKYDRSHVKWYRSNFAKTDLLEPQFAPKGSMIYKEWAKENL